MKNKLFVVLLILLAPCLAAAKAKKDEEPLRIHVLTMGPGDELFTKFGHIALMVEYRADRTNRVYNFGTFDFGDPNLRLRYVRGFLTYWLSVSTYSRIEQRYDEYNREMVIRTLDLPGDKAAELAYKLEINALPENREYAYRHYLDNCCTRIRDLIDDAADGALSRGLDDKPTGRTFRYWTRRALSDLPVMNTLILFSLGPAIDKPITRWDEQFLPEVLSDDLDKIRLGPDNRPLVSKKKTVVERRGSDPGSKMPLIDLTIIVGFYSIFVAGFGTALILGRRRAAARFAGIGLSFWGLMAGLGGLALVLYWTATEHTDTHYNENLLIMPVLHLWLIGPGFKLIFKARIKERTAKIASWYLIASLGLIVADVALKLGPFIQDNWEFIWFAAAADAAALAVLWRTGISPIPWRPARKNG